MAAEMHSPVCIIGAGPAGFTAALTLAKAGRESIIIDKSRFPRDKVCGDGIGGKFLATLNHIDEDLTRELCRQHFITHSYGVRFFSPTGKSALISFRPDGNPIPPGLICKRKEFDSFFASRLKALPNVRFIEDCNVSAIRISIDGAEVISDKMERICRSDLVLCANGSSRLSRVAGIPHIDNPAAGLGIRAYFENLTGSGPENAIEIHFLKELLPWYLWIFPFSDGTANAGLALPLGIIRKKRVRLEELFNEVTGRYPYLRERFKTARMSSNMAAAPLAIHHGPRPLSGDRFMLLGDAADLTDPFTGEGIGNAAFSGRAAALTAIECLNEMDFSAKMTGGYDRRISNGLGKELELDTRLCELAHNKSLLNLVIGRASRSRKIRSLIGAMLYDPGIKDNLKDQLFYLKLLLHLKL